LTCLKQHSLDASLREAVTIEMSAFLAAFDAVAGQHTLEDLELLRAATDKLLRAAAAFELSSSARARNGTARFSRTFKNPD
jgi:hypothetical protein